MKNFFLGFFSVLVASHLVLASGKNSTATTKDYNSQIEKVEVTPSDKLFFLDQGQFEKELSQVKKNSRHLSQAQTDVTSSAIEASFPEDFINLRSEILGSVDKLVLGVKNKEDLNRIVEKYSQISNRENLKSPEAQFLALQLRALKPYKSFFFRARNYIQKNSITRTTIVSMLRSQIAGIETFVPMSGQVNHAEVVFKYMTEPFDDMGPAIETDAQIYNFVSQSLNQYRQLFNEYDILVRSNPDFWWDNKLYLTFANFASEKDRYVKLGYAEHMSIYSSMSLGLSSLYATTAYSFEGLQAATGSTSQLFGFDVNSLFNPLGPAGASSMTRFQVLNKYPRLFSGTTDRILRMQEAYKFLVSSVRTARLSFEAAKLRSAGDQFLFDSRFANAFTRTGNLSFDKLDELFQNQTAASTLVVNGDAIKVDLKRFYYNPPSHLNELYPVSWKTESNSSEQKDIPVTAWGKKDVLRNYKYGMAAEWNTSAYKKLFPEIKGLSNNKNRTNEIGKFARVLSQTWGSAAFAVPLSAVIF